MTTDREGRRTDRTLMEWAGPLGPPQAVRRVAVAPRGYVPEPMALTKAVARKAQRPRTRTWVSKTDLARYVRCPYAFWLIDSGRLAPGEAMDPFQATLLAEGMAFHEAVEASGKPLLVGPADLKPLLREDVRILSVPEFENKALKIHGRPDGIDTANGALYPIEIKSHKDVQRLDELELAFYWLLLEPHRTRREGAPRGLLILRRDGRPTPVWVDLAPQRFDQVSRLLQEVRDARRRGVRERVCGCYVCGTLNNDHIGAVTAARKDVSLLFGVGRVYGPLLEKLGYPTWEAVLQCDAAQVAAAFREVGFPQVVSTEIERWKLHALSYQRQAPCLAPRSRFPLGKRMILLDLEYLPSLIWLIGVCVMTERGVTYYAWWADSSEDEKRNLGEFSALLAKHARLPVVTWSGAGADLPNMRAAAKRTGLARLADDLNVRHVDLFEWMRRHARLPIPRLGLKDVASYYGVPRVSSVSDGLQAMSLFIRYQQTRDVAVRGQLLDYNRDDLDALAAVARRLQDVACQ